MKRLIKNAGYNKEYLEEYFEGCEINYTDDGVEITAPVTFFKDEYDNSEIEDCIDTNAKVTFKDYDLESFELPLIDDNDLDEELINNEIDDSEFEYFYDELNKDISNSLLDVFENEIWQR